MVKLLDFLTYVIPAVITLILYGMYYSIFVKGYVKKIEKTIKDGELDKAFKMRKHALERQPKRMKRLLSKLNLDV